MTNGREYVIHKLDSTTSTTDKADEQESLTIKSQEFNRHVVLSSQVLSKTGDPISSIYLHKKLKNSKQNKKQEQSEYRHSRVIGYEKRK